MDAHVLEQQKENITPLVHGRSASKLGKALTESRNSIQKQRDSLEKSLAADDLDDPLQSYLDYIEWTHNHYPQGHNSESGLLQLLERCTSCFRDTPYYKNDPRYLRVWLEYAQYSDSPRDIFVYLARKAIGSELALYYEEFSKYLESTSQLADAREVLEIGAERSARPLNRLLRSLHHFQERITLPDRAQNSAIRELLTKRPAATVAPHPKRQKLAVHVDSAEPTLRQAVFSDSASSSIPLPSSKENSIAARPWAGETLLQNLEPEKKQAPKFRVFRDSEPTPPAPDFNLVEENGQTYTMVQQPGKPTERLCVNMKLLYPSADEEYCLGEILALSMKFNEAKEKKSKDSPKGGFLEHNSTFTIPLRDDDTAHRPRSPTMTLHSRATTNEVYEMFNHAAKNYSDDESVRELEESTNYDGFVTETIEVAPKDGNHENAEGATPPTDHYDSDGSSPFMERPRR